MLDKSKKANDLEAEPIGAKICKVIRQFTRERILAEIVKGVFDGSQDPACRGGRPAPVFRGETALP